MSFAFSSSSTMYASVNMAMDFRNSSLEFIKGIITCRIQIYWRQVCETMYIYGGYIITSTTVLPWTFPVAISDCRVIGSSQIRAIVLCTLLLFTFGHCIPDKSDFPNGHPHCVLSLFPLPSILGGIYCENLLWLKEFYSLNIGRSLMYYNFKVFQSQNMKSDKNKYWTLSFIEKTNGRQGIRNLHANVWIFSCPQTSPIVDNQPVSEWV